MSLCLLCPGQGSQTPDMLTRLAGDPLCAPHLQRLSTAIDAATLAHAEDARVCFQNRHAQPLIVLFGLTVVETLRDAGVSPSLVAGYSVGELTAQAAAGALSSEVALALADRRASVMDAASPPDHGMLAVRGVPLADLQALAASHQVVVAIVNGPDHAVIAGANPTLDTLMVALADSRAAHLVRLPITVPAHSRWLAGGVPHFREALAAVTWHNAEVPTLSGLDGAPVTRPTDAIERLARQLSEPLDWGRTLDIAIEMGTTVFFEVGPGCSLTRMVRERHPDRPARSLSEFGRIQGAIDWLRKHTEH